MAVDVAQRLPRAAIDELDHVRERRLPQDHGDVDPQAAAAQRPREIVERGGQLRRPPFARVQLEQQHAERAHRVPAGLRAAHERRAEVLARLGVRVLRQPVADRLQLVGGAGEVLDDAVVQVRGDAQALGLECRVRAAQRHGLV